MAPTPVSTSEAPANLEKLRSIERRLESCLKDLRVVRAEIEKDAATKGVLGSRGLTEFVIEQLQATAKTTARGLSINDLLSRAERAGYAIPISRTLSKRLSERSYRAHDIIWEGDAKGQGIWVWQGSKEAN